MLERREGRELQYFFTGITGEWQPGEAKNRSRVSVSGCHFGGAVNFFLGGLYIRSSGLVG